MIKKSLFQFKKKVAFCLSFVIPMAVFILTAGALIYLVNLLGSILFSIILLVLILSLILISHFTDISIPILGTLLKKEYRRIQTQEGIEAYRQLIYFLALLFGSSKESLILIKDNILDEFKQQDTTNYLNLENLINQIKRGEEVDKKEVLSLEQQLIKFHRQNQKRVTIKTIIGIAGMILVLVSSLIYPLSVARAATYYFTQASWVGGADTVTTANHTSNQSDWNKYYFKSSGITAGANIIVTEQTASSTIDFTTEGNYVLEDSVNTQIVGGVAKIGADDNTKLLLHLDGPDNSVDDANFIDSSLQEHIVTQEDNAKLENTSKKFGDTSAYFDGTGDFVGVVDSDDFNFGSENFTIDLWVNFESVSSAYGAILGQSFDANNRVVLSYDGDIDTLYFNTRGGSSSMTLTGSWNALINTWYHLAVVRDGSDWHMFVDGVDLNPTGGVSHTLPDLSPNLHIGHHLTGTPSHLYHKGYIDEVRISKGVARWTENFTPPTIFYGGSPYYITTTDTTQVDVSTYSTISDVDLSQTTPTNTDIKYLVSFDGRSTWKYWTGSAWGSSSLANLQSQGMSKTTLEALSSANWSASGGFVAGATTTLDFAMDLSTSDSSVTPEIDQIKVNYTYFGSLVSNIPFTTEGNYVQENADYTGIAGGVGSLINLETGNLFIDGETIIEDENSTHTITTNSNPTVSTVQKQYGDSSIYFDGIDDYLSVPASGDWDFGSGDFTIDLWVNPTVLTNAAGHTQILGAGNDTAGGNYGLYFYDNGRLGFGGNGVWEFKESTASLLAETWQHIAIVRSGNIWYLFRNGSQIATTTRSDAIEYLSGFFTIGHTWHSSGYFNGYIDNIRVTKGTALWTSTFNISTDLYTYPTTSSYLTTSDLSQKDTSTWSSIDDLTITQTTPTNTDIKYLVSFDDRTTWKYWTGSAWATSSLDNLQSQGMSKTTLEALSSANWSASGGFVAGTTTTLDFAMDLSTSDSSVTPSVDNIAVTPEIALISSKYNTEVAANIMAGINWTEDSTLPASSQVIMYLRTAVSAVGLDSAEWNEVASSTPSFLTSGCTKSTGSITCDTTSIPAGLKDGSNDQWFQYKVVIDPGVTSPTVDNIVPIYVANGAPEVGTFTAVQGTDGAVDISYEIKDQDTTSGTVIANYVTPTFEYYNGSSWTSIATSSIIYGVAPVSGEVIDDNSDGYTDNKVLEDSYLTYTATWIASTTVADLYTAGFQMRATFDDKEAANNTVASTTIAGILDTTAPTSTSVIVDNSTSPATLTLAATDDSDKEMMISLDSGFAGASWESYSTSDTQSTTDPDTVYVKFRDVYGNESSVLNATTPNTPANVVIQDISNVNVTPATYDLFLTWGVIAEPSAGFGSYKVYHATDGINYSLESTIADRSLNYYVDRGLSADSVHQYKVLSVDANGNISAYSSAIAGTANGTQDGSEGGGGVEAVEPVITNTAASNITTQSATITWDTDELADSRVEYITSTGADFTDAPYVGKATMLNTAAGLGQHSIVLTGLTPDTTYYYQVKSTDINGNMATKVPGDNGFTFDTLAGPSISAVTTDTINNESAVITWTTDTVASSYVYYSTNSDLSSATQTGSADSVTSHSVTVSGLTSGTKYYYYVSSGTANDKNVINGEVAYYSLTTTQDSTAPIITFDSDTDITAIGDTTATVSWTTSEVATSTLEYGTSNSYGTTESNNNYNSNHSYDLTGLTAGTTYYIRLKSTDANSNTRTDDNAGAGWTFTTTDSSDVIAPNITTDPSASTIGDTFAYITWITDEASNSVVDYGTTSGVYTASSSKATLDTSHSVKLSGLTEEIKYYFRVLSTDANSNATTSAETFFTTLGALSEEAAVVIREEAARAEGIASAGAGSSYCGSNTSWNGTFCVAASSGGGGGGASCPVTDRKAPVISDVKVDVGATTATVTWATNEDANEGVQYGTGPEYGLLNGMSLNTSRNHKITLTKLYPSNQYFYKVISVDNSGNKAESPQASFTTLSSLEGVEKDTQEIEDIQETPVITTSSTVKTAQESLLQLATQKVNSIFSKMAGQVSVQKLEQNLVSTTQTIEDLSKYIPAPLLSSEPNVKVTSSSAIISWGTDKPANSLIELATEAEYNLNKTKPYTETRGEAEELTTSHIVVLYNLAPSTTYHYKLKSKSQVGPIAQSKDFIFKTNAEVPEITKWSVKDVEDHSATFVWETSVESTTEIEYTPYHQGELQKDRMKTKAVKGLSITHEITVDDLDGGATYFVRLKSTTQSGELITHTIPEFNNVDDVIPPQILQLRTESAVSSEGNKIQTIITWQTDELATSQVFYQEGASVNPEFVTNSELREDLVYRHTTVLGDLKPATVYRFNVQSMDSQGNLSISKDYTLLTPQKKQDVVEIIFSNFEKKFGWIERLGI